MRRLLSILFVTLVTVGAGAQQHPNEDRGFSPDKVYSFSDIDHVNEFNGNLILTIPVGGTYTVHGQLEYRLALVYNSNVWNILEKNKTVNGTTYPYYEADPNPHA